VTDPLAAGEEPNLFQLLGDSDRLLLSRKARLALDGDAVRYPLSQRSNHAKSAQGGCK
jgi:hypothetical protein